jgi:hypothetical protein
MGVHHYYLQVIPKSLAEKHKNKLAKVLEKQWAWKNEIPSNILLDELRGLLPKNTSWGEVEEFESENKWGSDVRIWKEGQKVEAIEFRYAPCADPKNILECFIKIVADEKGKCMLFARESKTLLFPDLSLILEDMKKSRAYRFIFNPMETIIEASEEIEATARTKLNDDLKNDKETS